MIAPVSLEIVASFGCKFELLNVNLSKVTGNVCNLLENVDATAGGWNRVFVENSGMESQIAVNKNNISVS